MGLIEDAIDEVKAERQWRETKDLGLDMPSGINEWHTTFYLTLRNDLWHGIRQVTKTVTERHYRSMVFQILLQALTDIFQYGKTYEQCQPYNDMLDFILGYH